MSCVPACRLFIRHLQGRDAQVLLHSLQFARQTSLWCGTPHAEFRLSPGAPHQSYYLLRPLLFDEALNQWTHQLDAKALEALLVAYADACELSNIGRQRYHR